MRERPSGPCARLPMVAGTTLRAPAPTRRPPFTSDYGVPSRPRRAAEPATLLVMPFGIGIWELLILLLVLLLVFGPKRLPEMGRQLGKGMREFKDSVSGNDDDSIDELAELPPPVEPPVEPSATTARERDTVS